MIAMTNDDFEPDSVKTRTQALAAEVLLPQGELECISQSLKWKWA